VRLENLSGESQLWIRKDYVPTYGMGGSAWNPPWNDPYHGGTTWLKKAGDELFTLLPDEGSLPAGRYYLMAVSEGTNGVAGQQHVLHSLGTARLLIWERCRRLGSGSRLMDMAVATTSSTPSPCHQCAGAGNAAAQSGGKPVHGSARRWPFAGFQRVWAVRAGVFLWEPQPDHHSQPDPGVYVSPSATPAQLPPSLRVAIR